MKLVIAPVLISLTLILLPLINAEEPSVSRTAPPGWKVFQKDLVPLEEALKLPAVPEHANEAEREIETILKHGYVRVEEDGSSLYVSHRVKKLLQESAREEFSTQRIEFRPSHEKIHVVAARTLTPEGDYVEVADQGIFLEQPTNPNDSLFTDRRAIRIVFPDTRPGSVIEWITVEESQPIIPNHWSGGTIWGDIAPLRSLRYVADFPGAMSGQVVWEGIGVKLTPSRHETDDGRVRWSWEGRELAAPTLQPAMPSLSQRGPRLRVGSGENWNRFGDWFSGLVAEASRSSGEVAITAKEWVGDASTPREKAEILLKKVSRDIRYTGLEFGDGAFQPRAPGDVVETRYGDCKDKSNLLRILLKEHGISSRLALLDSALPGEIPRTIASTSLFDHAILAVDLPGEKKPLFCDPTLDGVPLGTVSPRDQGKDVLIIGEAGDLEWSKIPRGGTTKVRMNADLAIEPTGAYSGWFEVRVSGAQGWMIRRHFEKTVSRAKRMDLAGEWFFRYVPGKKIVDGEPMAPDDGFPFHYRFYLFQDPASVQASEKTVRIQPHVVNQVFTYLGPEGTRIHPYVEVPSDCEVKVRFTLPESFEILDRGKDYVSSNEGIEITSIWTEEDNRLVNEIKMHRSLPEYSPRQFNGLSESVRGLVSHLSTPVLFLREEGAEGDDWTPDPDALPKMPSSEGFTELINARYPFVSQEPWDADHESRVRAFERMETLYGKEDHEGQFTAGLMSRTSRLFLAEDADECRTIAKETRDLITNYEGKLEPSKFTAAELIAASALLEAGETESSREICERILSDKSVVESIRQGAAAMMAFLVSEEDSLRSAELAKMALQSELLPDGEWMSLASIYLDALARTPPSEDALDLLPAMEWVISERPDLTSPLKDEFLIGPFQLVSYGHHEAAERFRDCLSANAATLELDDTDLKQLADDFDAIGKAAPLHERLRAYLSENPWPDLEKIEDGDSIENANDCLEVFHENTSVELRYILRGLTHYGPQPDIMDRLSEFHASAERWFEEEETETTVDGPTATALEAMQDLVIELWKDSPEGDETNLTDLAFAEGDLLERRVGVDAAIVYFLKVANDATVEKLTRLRSIQRVADLRSSQRDVGGYLKALEMFEPYTDFRGWRDDSVAQGAYIALAHRDREEAWRRLRLIASDEKEEENSYPEKVMKFAIGWTKGSGPAEAWWDRSEIWWPEWEKLAKSLELTLPFEGDLSDYEPWEGVPVKRIKQLTSPKSGKNSRLQFKQALAKHMEFTRWHRNGASGARLLLERGVEWFPKEAETLDRLIQSLNEAAGSKDSADPDPAIQE